MYQTKPSTDRPIARLYPWRTDFEHVDLHKHRRIELNRRLELNRRCELNRRFELNRRTDLFLIT